MGERIVFGPDILEEVEKQVRMVRENLRVAQSRQKSYADHRRRHARELHGIRGSRCVRCNGATIPRKRLHGKEKKS
jgi:hypothetical protein